MIIVSQSDREQDVSYTTPSTPEIIKDLRPLPGGCEDAIDLSILLQAEGLCEWFEVDYSQCVKIGELTFYPIKLKGLTEESKGCNGVHLPIICSADGLTVKLDTSSIVDLISDKLSETEVNQLATIFAESLSIEVSLSDINTAIATGTVAQRIQLCNFLIDHCGDSIIDTVVEAIETDTSLQARIATALGV